jgi:amino acid transporter
MNILDFLGLGITNPAGADALTNAQLLIGVIRNALILLFIVIIIFAVVYAALSGLKYIQSGGASDKIEEATESIKYVLIGVAVAFIGVIGVVIISNIFAPDTDAELSLRCFLGDLHLCSARVLPNGQQCKSDERACSLKSSGGSHINVCYPNSIKQCPTP